MALKQLLLLLIAMLSSLGCSHDLPHNLSGTSKSLLRRQCVWIPMLKQYDCNEYLPTLAQMLYRMRDLNSDGNVRPENRAIFYANLWPGVNGPLSPNQTEQMMLWCVTWMIRNNLPYYWVRNPTKSTEWYDYTVRDITSGAHKDKFATRYGSTVNALNALSACWIQAFALSPIHEDVYFFTASNSQPPDTTFWVIAEAWVLTRPGGNVKRIYQIDPRPETMGGKPCDPPRLIWLRGRDAPLVERWRCPVTHDDGTIPNLPDPWTVAAPVPTAPPG